MNKYMQVRPQHGYLAHAVPLTAERIGTDGRLTRHKPVCGKVKTHDGWGRPTLYVQFVGPVRNNNPALFTDSIAPEAKPCQRCLEIITKGTP